MEFHPKDLPIFKIYDLKDEKDATEAVDDMVNLGFSNRKEGFKVLMPKETLDCLTSFAISEEGTNTLYLGLIDIIARRTDLVTAASEIAIVASDADKGANNKSTIVPSIFLIIREEDE